MALALLVGAFAGGLIAAAGGARRISSAYERFTTATRAADVGVLPGCRSALSAGVCVREVDPSELAVLDVVDEMAVGYAWHAPITTLGGTLLNPIGDSCFDGSGEVSVLGSGDGRLGTSLNRFQLNAGRLADAADEVMLSLATAQRAGVRIGDVLLLYLHRRDCMDERSWGSPTRVRVVGIGQMAAEVPGSQGFRIEGVHITPALSTELLGDTRVEAGGSVVFIRLADGASAGDLIATAEAAEMPIQVLLEADSLRRGVRQRLTPDSTVLWLVAVVGGVAAVIVLGSAIAHVGATTADDASALHGLGWRRREFALSGSAAGAAIGLVAGAFAALVAVGASGVVMIGDARQIDPERGLRLDWWPIVIGLVITVVVVTSAFTIGRLGATGRSVGRRRAKSGRRWSDVLLPRVPRLPVSAVVGIRFATAPVSRGSVPFWRGAVGVTFGIAGVVAALTFLAGVDHLVTTPRLVGVTWDALAGLPEEPPATPAEVDKAVDELRQDPRVRAASAGTYFSPFAEITVGEERIQVVPMSLSTGSKALKPAIIDGRAPAEPNEILLNPLLADRLGVSLGASVEVRVVTTEGADHTYPFELVGTGVLPVPDGRPEIGTSITLDGMRRLAPDGPAQFLFVDLRDGVAANSVLDDFDLEVETEFADLFGGMEQLLGINVTRTRQAPILLAVVLGIMAAGVLAHLAISAVRARASEIAVSRALGFDSRQVRHAMTWMVTILGAASLAVALPLGMVAGRVAFAIYAERLGVPVEPAVAVWPLASLVPALLLSAYLTALWPGWRASKVATTTVLRTE